MSGSIPTWDSSIVGIIRSSHSSEMHQWATKQVRNMINYHTEAVEKHKAELKYWEDLVSTYVCVLCVCVCVCACYPLSVPSCVPINLLSYILTLWTI
jgi:hypothetical protein